MHQSGTVNWRRIEGKAEAVQDLLFDSIGDLIIDANAKPHEDHERVCTHPLFPVQSESTIALSQVVPEIHSAVQEELKVRSSLEYSVIRYKRSCNCASRNPIHLPNLVSALHRTFLSLLKLRRCAVLLA